MSDGFTSISSYTSNFIAVTFLVLFRLKEMISYVQLRWFCFLKNARVRVFHVASVTGHHFVKYFLKGLGDMAEACQSFTVLPGDNWKLSRNCDKWGSNETVSLSNLYGFYVVIMPLQMACHHEILEKSMRDRNRHALAPIVDSSVPKTDTIT